MCKQTFPLKSIHFHQQCQAKLLEPTISVPLECNRKIVTLNEAVYLLLNHNTWIFTSTQKERVVYPGNRAIVGIDLGRPLSGVAVSNRPACMCVRLL
jgi:hypothetical protein